jgi:hypothetical protein
VTAPATTTGPAWLLLVLLGLLMLRGLRDSVESDSKQISSV